MKKIFTLIAVLAAMSCGANASAQDGANTANAAANDTMTFTEKLIVVVNGSSTDAGNQSVKLYKQTDGKYTFLLKNLVIGSGESVMYVGNISITDVPGTVQADGSVKIKGTQNVKITAGDSSISKTWIGPTISTLAGSIPVAIDGTLTADQKKFTATMDIDLSKTMLKQTIKCYFGIDPTGSVGTVSSDAAAAGAVKYIKAGGQLVIEKDGVSYGLNGQKLAE